MPAYTVECTTCEAQRTILKKAADVGFRFWKRARFMCPICKTRTCRRVLTPHQVIDNTYPQTLNMYSVKDANNPKGFPRADSRSEMRRQLERSNRAFGTTLVPAGEG